jgi:UDP-N-acetyl-D-glucosamine dehydrogenase
MLAATSIDRSLAERIEAGEFSAGVIGLGAVGAVTAELIAGSGVPVCGCDINRQRLEQIREPLAKVGCAIDATSDHLAEADVIVVAVRAPMTSDGGPNLSAVRSALGAIREMPRKERLVVLETTMPPGTTRQLADECFTASERAITHIAHCPERLRVGDGPRELREVPRLVAGLTPQATAAACAFLTKVGVRPVPVTQPEVAELSKLLENTFLTTGIALMAEVTRIAHALGIEAREVAAAAQTKPHGYYPFIPGAGVGGHCLPNDLRLLRNTAERLGTGGEFLAGVAHSTAQMADTTVTRLETLLLPHDIALSGALVWIIGVGFKPGCPDTTGTPATNVIRRLRAAGARVIYSDSQVPSFSVDDEPVEHVPPGVTPMGCHASLILSGDRTIDLGSFDLPVVLNAGGAHVMTGQCQKMAHL